MIILGFKDQKCDIKFNIQNKTMIVNKMFNITMTFYVQKKAMYC